MKHCLAENEKVFGDLGYRGLTIVYGRIMNDADGKCAMRLRAYYKNVNGGMKRFNCSQHK